MNAIYVGLPLTSSNGSFYHYGVTGKMTEVAVYSDIVKFEAEGAPSALLCRRDEVYIPALDATRHCPKP